MGDPNVNLPPALTRWITHFCAPVFVLLEGPAPDMAARVPGGAGEVLLTRGLWLRQFF
jgi:uncharacterized membrane protein